MDAVTEYVIFRDLLNIFFAFAAVVATVVTAVMIAIYKILSDKIEEKVKKKVTSAAKTEVDQSLLYNHITSGLDYWKEYDEHMTHLFCMDGVLEENWDNDSFLGKLKNMLKTKDIQLSENDTITEEKEDKLVILDRENKNIFVVRKEGGKLHIYKRDTWKLEQAIEITVLGYDKYATKLEQAIEITVLGYDKYATKLDEQEQFSEWLICWIKNNLAYFYAERHKFKVAEPDEVDKAQKFAAYIHERAASYPREDAKKWIDTHKVVQDTFSLNE